MLKMLPSLSPSIIRIVVLLCLALSCTAFNTTESDDHTKVKAATPSIEDSLRGLMKTILDPSNPLAQKVLTADLSFPCSLGLLRLVRGLKNLEPWALRIIDASGKYPTGFLHGTTVDLGSFDECVATVERDQHGYVKTKAHYCMVQIRLMTDETAVKHLVQAAAIAHKRVSKFLSYWIDPDAPGARLGICIIDQCSEQDIEAIAKTLITDSLNVTVSDCVNGQHPPMSSTQAGIICLLACIGAMMFLSSCFHFYLWLRDHPADEGQLVRLLTSFSVLKNTKHIVNMDEKSSSDMSFDFMNGMRFLSIAWIILGHVFGGMTDVLSGRINMMYFFDDWASTILPAGFLSVDTFMFLSGFLLINAVFHQKRSAFFIAPIAVIRRYIRVVVPVVFLILCIQLLPLAIQGPNTNKYYRDIHMMVHTHWKHFLLQVYNFKHEIRSIALIHIWYVSTDFQLFLVSLAVILVLRWSKLWCVGAFVVLAILSCVVCTLQIHKTEMSPFIIGMTEEFSMVRKVMNLYYVQPFYHAVCFFSGCITWLLKDSFSRSHFSKVVAALCWIASLACGITCVFIKYPWYHEKEPTGEWGKLSTAFFDRILWSICLSWITLTCSTKRGGIMNSFLSWRGFGPLSKLTFAVYLVHMPLYDLMNHFCKERTYFSHFSLVTQFFSVLVWSYFLGYLLYISCEAPLGHIDRLLFNHRRQPNHSIENKKIDNENAQEKRHNIILMPSGGVFHKYPVDLKFIGQQ
nr:nose resistant to fluoxetine protein 6-like [Rhipicephalus microplus]